MVDHLIFITLINCFKFSVKKVMTSLSSTIDMIKWMSWKGCTKYVDAGRESHWILQIEWKISVLQFQTKLSKITDTTDGATKRSKEPDFIECLSRLGESWDLSDELLYTLEHFTCSLYGRKSIKSVNELRYILLTEQLNSSKLFVD